MGTEEKVVFRFSERFWPDSLWEVTHVAGDRAFPVWFDFSRHVGAPTLVTIYNPRSTRGLAQVPPEGRAERALEVVRKLFRSAPDPEETLTTDWAEDARSLGAYSYVPVGASVEDMGRLGEPVSERLTLAGEATSPDCYGTVQAAFRSGLRAASVALGGRPERLSLGMIPSHWLS
jgi:polyamine oxidase